MRFRMFLAVGLVLGLSSTACGADERSDAGRVDGEPLFTANCSGCHGAAAVGTPRGPSLLSEVYKPSHHPDDAFRSAVANGSPQHHWSFGPMPGVGGLGADEVNAIIGYVRDLQAEQGFVPYGP